MLLVLPDQCQFPLSLKTDCNGVGDEVEAHLQLTLHVVKRGIPTPRPVTQAWLIKEVLKIVAGTAQDLNRSRAWAGTIGSASNKADGA